VILRVGRKRFAYSCEANPVGGPVARPAPTLLGRYGEQLADWLAEPGEPDEAGLHLIARLIEKAGGRSWAVAEAEREVELVVSAVESVLAYHLYRLVFPLSALGRYLGRDRETVV
jgi:hypothetical protein